MSIDKDLVLLIGINGEKFGNQHFKEAERRALEAGVDLVKVGDKEGIPVYKLINVGKEKYQKNKQKKSSVKPKKVKQIEIRPGIDIGDLKVKTNHVRQFLKDGHKVKVIVKYKGREITHKEVGVEKVTYIIENTRNEGLVEGNWQMEGKNQIVNITPLPRH